MPVREGVRRDPTTETVKLILMESESPPPDLCRCGCLVCDCGNCPDCLGHAPTCPKASGAGVYGSSR